MGVLMWTGRRGVSKSSPNIVQNRRRRKRKRGYLIFFVNCNELFRSRDYVNFRRPPPAGPPAPAKSRTILWQARRRPPYLGGTPALAPAAPVFSPFRRPAPFFLIFGYFHLLTVRPPGRSGGKQAAEEPPSPAVVRPPRRWAPRLFTRALRTAAPCAFCPCSGRSPAGGFRPPGPPAARRPPWRGPVPSGRSPRQWRRP